MTDKELDKFFDAAKGQDNLISPLDAQKIIEADTQNTAFGDFLRRNKMKFLAVSIAVILATSTFLISSLENNEVVENNKVKRIEKQQIIENNDETNDDFAINEITEKTPQKEIVKVVKTEKTVVSKEKPKKDKKQNQIKVEGLNPINLSLKELEQLGIVKNGEKSLKFTALNNSNSPALIELTPTSYDWSFTGVFDSLESISPVFITDGQGNKRISLFTDGNGFAMLESFGGSEKQENTNPSKFEKHYTNSYSINKKINNKKVIVTDNYPAEINKFENGRKEKQEFVKPKIQFQQNVKIITDDSSRFVTKELIIDSELDSAMLKQIALGDPETLYSRYVIDSLSREDREKLVNLSADKMNNDQVIAIIKDAMEKKSQAEIMRMDIEKEKVIINNDTQSNILEGSNGNAKMMFHFMRDSSKTLPELANELNKPEIIKIIESLDIKDGSNLNEYSEKLLKKLEEIAIEDGLVTESQLINKDGKFSFNHSASDSKVDKTKHNYKSNPNIDIMYQSVEDFVDVNELIPVSIKFDGVNTDYILWFEPNELFIDNLPEDHKNKLAPEINAIQTETAVCGPAPSEEAVMDVWRGCSGALKDLKLYPNPAVDKVNVQFELEDLRSYRISINDINGAEVKTFKTEDVFNNNFMNAQSVELTGPQDITLNINDLKPGMYYVVVETQDGEQAVQRLIVNK